MDGDDEYGFDEEFTAEDFHHMDEIESAAYAGEFNSYIIFHLYCTHYFIIGGPSNSLNTSPEAHLEPDGTFLPSVSTPLIPEPGLCKSELF